MFENYKSNKRANQLRVLIENAKKICTNNKLFEINVKLVRMKSLLDNNNELISKSVYNEVSDSLKSIIQGSSQENIEVEKHYCNKCLDLLSHTSIDRSLSKDEKDEESNSVRVLELQGKIRSLEKQLKNISKEQKEAVANNDKLTWSRLQIEKKTAIGQVDMLSASYSNLFKQKANISTANMIKMIKEKYSDEIIKQSSKIDTAELRGIANENKAVTKEVEKTTQEIADIVFDSTDGNSIDDEWNKAREKHLVKNKKESFEENDELELDKNDN